MSHRTDAQTSERRSAGSGRVRAGQAWVIESPSTVIWTAASGALAGPDCGEPSSRENLLPWQGHGMSPSVLDSTRQPWWVHTAVNALKSPSVGWVSTILESATTKHPHTGTPAVLARAAPPPDDPDPSLDDAP